MVNHPISLDKPIITRSYMVNHPISLDKPFKIMGGVYNIQ